MGKHCEIKEYIKTITSNSKEQEVLNDLHNKIFDEIKASKQFKYIDGYLMEKDISKGYIKEVNEGRAVVKAIETKYGTGTAWIAKSKAGDRNHVYVSVRPIADKYINKGNNGEQTTLFQLQANQVNYALKAVNILQSDKAKQVFDKGNKNKWSLDKILTELLIPKEQKQLILDLGVTDREQLVLELASNYSYTVEINTAKEGFENREKDDESIEYWFTGGDQLTGDIYQRNALIGTSVTDYTNNTFTKNGEEITKEEFNKALAKYKKEKDLKPTQYYSNLTVPGGTNYTENEIKTPLITPSIKGHAQFSTDNGIGWFRSDEQAGNKEGTEVKKYQVTLDGIGQHKLNSEEEAKSWVLIHAEKWRRNPNEYGIKPFIKVDKFKDINSKTRRILEVQSDLFQKGRDKNDLITKRNSKISVNGIDYFINNNKIIAEDTINDKYIDVDYNNLPKEVNVLLKQLQENNNINETSNQFLQLLSKDNNWVTFFVKSIIQDSAKKGYKKVLFPSGNTASKVEGHTTLEEFRKEKEDRIKKLELQKSKIEQSKGFVVYDKETTSGTVKGRFDTKEEAEKFIKDSGRKEYDILEQREYNAIEATGTSLQSINNEISQLKEELEKVETEGFGALKPIYNFYENTVTNILKKQGFSPRIITDEYGNTWNEVEIKPDMATNPILFQQLSVRKKNELVNSIKTLEYDYIKANGIKIEFVDSLLNEYSNDPVAVYEAINKVIKVNVNKASIDTIPEELAHHLSLALGKDHTLVKRALNLIGRLNYKAILGPEYVEVYNNNPELLKWELLGKLISKQLVNSKLPNELNSENGVKIWETIKNLLKAFISLFKPNSNIQKELDRLTSELASMIDSGVKVDETTEDIKLFQLGKNSKITVKTGMSMHASNFEKLENGDKNFTLRTTNHLSGIYKFGDNYYNVLNLYGKAVNITEVENPDYLKKKFINDENIKYEHIKAFFDGNNEVYIYQITKVDDKIKNAIENQNKNKLLDDSIRAPYVYYKGLINQNKRKLDNLSKNDPERNKIQSEINKLQAGLNEVLEGNKQALLQMTTETLDTIQKYLDKLYKVVQAGNKPDLTNIEKTVKVLDTFSTIAGLETRALDLKAKLLPFAKESLIENIERVTGKETPEDVFESREKDIFIGKANFGTLSDITDYLGKSIGLLIKEAQGKVERANREDYNKLEEHTKKLEEYAKNNGMSLQDVYNLFIQEGRGTYILTKPYSEEFYKLIDDSFKMDTTKGKTFRKSFARYNEETKEWIPKDKAKYINNNYQIIESNPDLKAYYKFFQESIEKISKKLPIGKDLKNDFIPNIVQQSILDLLKTDKDTLSKMGDLAKHILDLDNWDEKESKYLFDEDLEKDTIPLKFLGKLSPDIKSKDLGTALLKFMYFGNNYEYMDDILPKVRLLQEFIKKKKYIKNTNSTKAISGEDTNVNKMIEAFIQMQILEKNPKEQKFDPYIDFAIKYTSLLRIGLNPFNAVSNVIIGNIGNFIESVGGRYFSIGSYLDALKTYSADRFINDSKTHKITDLLNPLMELEDYNNLNKISVGRKVNVDKLKSFMYSFQRGGEHQIQVTTMIAILKTQKVTTKNGEKISMWEAFDENGNWNNELMGYELNEGDIFKLTNKVQRVNQMIHGRYSKKDAVALSQYSLFRAAFQFKKWIPAALEARFGEENFDDRLDSVTRGRYLSIAKAFKQMWARIKGDIELLEKNKFDEVDLYNMRKNYTEFVLILSIVLAGIGFKDDKKRKDPMYKFIMRQLNQTTGDLLYFVLPDQMTETVATGAPMLKTLQDLYKLVPVIPTIFTGEEYTKGRMAKENKFLANAINLTPVVKPIADVVRTFKKEPYILPR